MLPESPHPQREKRTFPGGLENLPYWAERVSRPFTQRENISKFTHVVSVRDALWKGTLGTQTHKQRVRC